MTVTTNDRGQQNMWAKEPTMTFDEKYTVNSQRTRRTPQWPFCHDGHHCCTWCICSDWPNHSWHLVMAAPIFLVTSITFFVLLGYAVEKVSETY